MYTVVGVSFKKAGKIYYFDPGDIDLNKGDNVIVETARGIEFGELVQGKKEVKEEEIVAPLKKVIRIANQKDKDKNEENHYLEREAFDICLEKIKKHDLPMKLIDVEYTFDHNKIIFYFTADGRIDFRELVKDLASNATEVDTDDSTSYVNLKKYIPKHNAQVIPKEKVGEVLPWVHIAISNAKRQLINTFHDIKPEFLQNYLDEFCYKFNRRYYGEALFNRLLVASVSYKNEFRYKYG